jgi:dihydroorotate dehydrogenase
MLMNVIFEHGRTKLPTKAIRNLAGDIGARLGKTQDEIAVEAKGDASILTTAAEYLDIDEFWPFVRLAYERNLIDLIPANGVPPLNYDLTDGFRLDRAPFGLSADFSQVKLDVRPTKIAGHLVDFPLGVPASILTTNSSYLKYYADKGFCILTYKTVRPKAHEGNSFPQWASMDNPSEFEADETGELTNAPTFTARLGGLPKSTTHGTMANSFGVPSHTPAAWQRDVAKARGFVREGHQLLIVSVMPSAGDLETSKIEADFAETAVLAKQVGADVIELNYSCPNTRGEQAGLLYRVVADAKRVSKAVRDAVGGGTSVFVKIGYLNDNDLYTFTKSMFPYIDGIVAINTISAPVIGENKDAFFPNRKNNTAGISGWAMRKVSQRLARSLVRIRDELAKTEGKRLAVLGLGGVMTKDDFQSRLDTGVDAVEICTGAYFNQFLGFEIRNAQGKIKVSPQDANIGDGPALIGDEGALGRFSAGATKPSKQGGNVVSGKTRHQQKQQTGGSPLAEHSPAEDEETDLLSLVPDSALDPDRARNLELICNESDEEFFRALEQVAPGNPYAEEMLRRAREKKLIK